MRPYIKHFASAKFPITNIEYYNEDIDSEAFAEISWPKANPPIAVLVGDQCTYKETWRKKGWRVITFDDIREQGIDSVINSLESNFSGEE